MAKILIADDSITVRKVAERLLTEAGLDVVLAANGEEAVSRLDSERPDFVISDVIMPDKSGYDVCRVIRAHADLSGIPVLLISGVVNEEVTRQTDACLADGVLKKPFQGTSLKDRVLDLIEKHRHQQPAAAPAAPMALTPVIDEPTSAEPAAAEPAAASAQAATGRVYRITEQQLETFRRASGRIRELEAQLADERTRAGEMQQGAAQIGTLQGEVEAARARVSELEAGRETVERRVEAQAAELAHIKEQLAAAQRHASQASKETDEVARLQVRLAEMELLISEQRERATKLVHDLTRMKQSDDRLQTLERALAEEQTKMAEMTKRLNALDEAASRAHARAEALAEVLAQIASLAGQPLPPADRS